MSSTYEIVVVIHVISAIVWVGGVVFIGGVAVPASRKMSEETGRQAVSAIARRFRPVGWGALGFLVATGFYMIWEWGARPDNLLDGSFFANDRHWLLGIKLILVGLMLVVSGIHDWYVGPRASALAREADDEETARPWRRWAAILGIVTGLLVIAIVVIAVYVARPWMVG